MGARAGITTGATLSRPFLASWFLERKLGEGYKDTLDQSDWCLMFLCSQAWISLLRFLKSYVLSLYQLVQYQGKVPGGDAPLTLGSVSVEAIQETSEILILLTLIGKFPNLSAMADL